MKTVLQYIAAAVITAMMTFTGTAANATGTTNPAPAMTDSMTAFALDLYQREKTAAPNLFFSPYSISAALAMASSGARGQTAEEMLRTLHLENLAQPLIGPAFAGVQARLERIERDKTVQLSVANSLWAQQDYPFKTAFIDLNQQYFKAELRRVDFARKPEGVTREINAWVEEKTHDKIRDLMQPGQIDGMTRLLLCNAIYFKGDWAKQFDPKATRPEPFLLNSNQNVKVPMMSRSLPLRHQAFDDFTLFALPYVSNKLEMIVLLPKSIEGLAAVEVQLNPANLQAWLKKLNSARATEARVAMPKFKVNCRLDLAKALVSMGMPSAFSRTADFSGMTDRKDLYISGVVHQAYVDVNEEGTEAGAATGLTMRATSARPTVVLRVDHPFLFFILEPDSGSILFLGRVTNPT